MVFRVCCRWFTPVRFSASLSNINFPDQYIWCFCLLCGIDLSLLLFVCNKLHKNWFPHCAVILPIFSIAGYVLARRRDQKSAATDYPSSDRARFQEISLVFFHDQFGDVCLYSVPSRRRSWNSRQVIDRFWTCCCCRVDSKRRRQRGQCGVMYYN